MVGDTRQGWTVLAAMTVIFVVLLGTCYLAEQNGAVFVKQGVDHTASALQSGGNMEGKETRFGIASSAIWATATTSSSNGSVNSMHDSYTPIGGLVPMWMIQLGEVVYGGVGSGLYGMVGFPIVAVFVAGFSEVLYAFSSASNNNGSAFAGLNANTPFYNTSLGLAFLFGRYWLAVPVLALAGSLARKKLVPPGLGTLATHTPLFVVLLVGTVILVGALTYVPALALGPIAEHLTLVMAK